VAEEIEDAAVDVSGLEWPVPAEDVAERKDAWSRPLEYARVRSRGDGSELVIAGLKLSEKLEKRVVRCHHNSWR
jgi:hypothetical protein